ncbi:MAG: alpha/beta hydrolase [Bacteroidetes bacterium]|nr:MAG: alpha/beta hydrolase [Bacteroidota bacterium]
MKKLTDEIKTVFANWFFARQGITKPNDEILLWPNNLSDGKERIRVVEGRLQVVSNIHNPSIRPFIPSAERATGAAVIIAPGGGHSEIWIDREGYRIAELLKNRGIAAFVLKYRLANEKNSPYTVEEHALKDIQRAIRLVRSRAKKWGINKSSVGVMGFSAGGELAALASSRFDFGKESPVDAIDGESAYANFQALIYPAGISHLDVLKNSPPLFLLGGLMDDPEVSGGMSNIYLKYKRAGILAELYIYADAGQGLNMNQNNFGAISRWPERFEEWLGRGGFLKKRMFVPEAN